MSWPRFLDRLVQWFDDLPCQCSARWRLVEDEIKRRKAEAAA